MYKMHKGRNETLSLSNEFHEILKNVTTNKKILENLQFLCKSGCNVEIRYPLVKGYNDGECIKIAEFLRDLSGVEKIKVLQYHSFSASRYDALGMENTLPNTETLYKDVEEAVSIFRSNNLNAVNGINGE